MILNIDFKLTVKGLTTKEAGQLPQAVCEDFSLEVSQDMEMETKEYLEFMNQFLQQIADKIPMRG